MQRHLALGKLTLACVIILQWSPRGLAENWPQWRGPHNDGISQETNLPSDWNSEKNLAWKLKLPGMSGATPIVWEDRIYLTSEAGDKIVLLCVSADGKEVWRSDVGSGKRRFRVDEGNQSSPSPSTDGKHVYVFAGTGDFACFAMAGKQVWHFNAQERYGKFQIQHGMHVTPLLHEDKLYLSLLHSGAWMVIALDKNTGKEVWKIERDSDATAENEHSYASPCLATNGGEPYIVVHGNDYTTAHRLADGSEIWRLTGLNPKAKYHTTLRFVASPVAVNDLIVLPTAKNGPVVAVKPDAKGAIVPGSPFEQWRRPSNTPDVSSPLIHGGLVYLCRENGTLIVLDAKTGKEYYQHRLHGARYRASPVYADGKIYCTARDGTVSVVKAGSKFEMISVNKLPDQLAASPAIANGSIYLRGFDNLYCVRQSGR